MSIKFPNVPKAAGVPDVLRNPSLRVPTVLIMVKDTVGALLGSKAAEWGIYKGTTPVLIFDSFISLDARRDTMISDYPVEKGTFESYNKVSLPGEVRVRLAKGGSSAERGQFMSRLKVVCESTEIYNITTPEGIYEGYNIIHYDYSRASQNGVSLIIADLSLQEIRQNATATFSQSNPITKAASGAAQVNDGVVQSCAAAPGIPAPLVPSLPAGDDAITSVRGSWGLPKVSTPDGLIGAW